MSHLLDGRRRMIRSRGRPMVLKRRTMGQPEQAVRLIGFATRYQPGQIEGAIQQGDQRVEILNDELAAAGWAGGPAATDWLEIDGLDTALQGATPVYAGALLIGHSFWVRG